MKPEQETEDDGEGYVTDEDEAADISHEAQAALDKTGEGAEGASATPPVKRKEKKPKKVRSSVKETLLLFANHCWSYNGTFGLLAFSRLIFPICTTVYSNISLRTFCSFCPLTVLTVK